MTNQEVLDKVVAAIGTKTRVRTELEPAAELSGDPLIVLRNNPPAIRDWRVSDDGTGKTWFRKLSCVVMLAATGAGAKAMRKAMQAPSAALAALFVNDDDGFDVALDDDSTWFAAVQGTLKPGDALSKDPEKVGTWNWNEAWDVVIYVPENAFAQA
jgi:hypothetical protein